jgi:hypothetical protein
MDSLQINTGEKRIAINNDPNRVIVFDPYDVVFAEKFYRLIGEFKSKLAEYQAQSKALGKDKRVDDNGVPLNAEKRITLLKESCEFARQQIDVLFGEGTSQKAFGDSLNIHAIKEFLEGMTPFIQTVRVKKVQTYTNKRQKRVL